MEESSELWEEAFFTTSSSSSSQFIQPNGGDLGGEVAYRRIGPRRRYDGEGSYILDPQSSYSDFRRRCYHRLCHPSLATFEV